MRFRLSLFVFVLMATGFISCSNPAGSASESGRDQAPQYQLLADWPQLPDSLVLGNAVGLGLDSDDNLFVFHRAERTFTNPLPTVGIPSATILKLASGTGALIDSWGQDLFIMPHGLTIDREDNIWVTDVGSHQVFKFDRSGDLLLTLGEAGVPGDDLLHFDRPTDVAVAADGSFYVSDGYGNSRVMKFSPEGEFQLQWGTYGSEPGQFNLPHGIDLDAEGKVYVADRSNNRIQVFAPDGKLLQVWPNEREGELYAVAVDRSGGQVFAIDYQVLQDTLVQGSDVLRLGMDGQLRSRFGRSGAYDGPVCRYHDIALGQDGSLYTGDILGNRVQKFSPTSVDQN